MDERSLQAIIKKYIYILIRHNFTFTFDQFNASLQNNNIHGLKNIPQISK